MTNIPVEKTIVRLTILHPKGETVEGKTLGDIVWEIEDGGWLGQIKRLITVAVDPVIVEEECKALGNDGRFFKELEEPTLGEAVANALDGLVEEGKLETDGNGNYKFPGDDKYVITPPDEEEDK